MNFLATLSTRQKNALMALGLFVFTFVVYLPALQNGYVWDDAFLIENNSAFRAGQLNVADLFRPIIPNSGFLRPVVLFSFYLEDVLLGLSPLHSHLVNHLLYAVIAVLVYVCSRQMLQRLDVQGATGLALLVALLYITNHAANEAVLWVSGRFDLMATLFMLCFVWRFLGEGTSRLHLPLLWLCYALALFSKEVALMLLPALFFLHLLKRPESTLKNAAIPALLGDFFRTQKGLLVGLLGLTIGYFALKFAVNHNLHQYVEQPNNPLADTDFYAIKLVVVTLYAYLATALTSFLTFSPAHYLTADLLSGPGFWSRAVGVGAFLLMLGWGVLKRDRRFIPWCLALLFIFPALHVVPFTLWVGYYQDRYTSQFLAFFLLGAVLWLPLLAPLYRRLVLAALGLVLVANLALMPLHAREWRSTYTLWLANYLRNYEKNPLNTSGLLLSAAFETQHYDVFEQVYQRLPPEFRSLYHTFYHMVLINMDRREGLDYLLPYARHLEQQGPADHPASADQSFVNRADSHDVVFCFVARGLTRISGDFPLALHYAQRAVQLNPSSPQNQLALSMAYYANGDLQRGEQYYRVTLRGYTSDKAPLLAQTRQDYFKKICAFPQSGRNPICQAGR